MPDVDATHWIVDLAVERVITLPSGETLDRGAFFEWIWAECDAGLVGLDEGAIDVADAATLGLVASPRVLDAAAAPADRDWVAGQPTAAASCWFVDEASARKAEDRLAGVTGCRVRGVQRQETALTADDWRAAFAPIIMPGFGTIHPAWESGRASVTADGVTMFIDPGTGFGTGLHETTQLCLRSLAEWIAQGGSLRRVLDFGSGSGILGIAAAICGAAHVASVEIDGTAHAAIRANADRNGVVDRIRITTTIATDAEPYDLVFANIVAAVLLENASPLCSGLQRDRQAGLILSGLLAEDVPAVASRYAQLLDTEPRHTSAGDWHCLLFTPPPRA